MWMVLLSLSAWADAPALCGTPAKAPFFLEIDKRPPQPPTDALYDNESHGDVPNRMYSEHFALKWGNSNPLSTAEAERWLNDFEDMLVIMRDEWGMNDPTGTGGTYFNVYLGDSGNDVPSVNGAAGYFTLTSSGYPMIVLSDILRSDTGYARAVIAHEFFHAAQWAEEAYLDWDVSAWYWEATATWAMGEIVPEDNSGAGFLPFYAMQPQAGLYHHSLDENGGAPPDAHQYGAFIFPQYIAEKLNQPEAIIDSWRFGEVEGDPVTYLRQHLSPEVFNQALVGHAAHMVGWDYDNGDVYNQYVLMGMDRFPEHDRQLTELQASEDDWFLVNSFDAPSACGYNTIEIPDGWLSGNQLTVSIEAASDVGGHLQAQVVSYVDDELDYHPIDSSEAYDNITVDPDAYLWLIVANVSTQSESPHPTPYRVSFMSRGESGETGESGGEGGEGGPGTSGGGSSWFDDGYAPPNLTAINEEPPKSGGCSHAAQGDAPLGWIIGLLSVLGLRRRREA